MKKIKTIINADDFGLTQAINYGIIEAHINGVLTSTTLMVTMPGVDHAVKFMKCLPNLGVGLHINVSLGKPLTECKSLVDEEGLFIKPQFLNKREYDEEELYQEIKAQYDLFKKLTQQEPSHFDTHLFSSDKIMSVQKAVVRLANEVSVPVRNLDTKLFPRTEFITFRKYDKPMGLDYLLECHEDFSNYDAIEIMSHPGYLDRFIMNVSSYSKERLIELELLTSKEMKTLFSNDKYELINYNQIKNKS